MKMYSWWWWLKINRPYKMSVKLGVSILVMGIAFTLFVFSPSSSSSSYSSSVSPIAHNETPNAMIQPFSVTFPPHKEPETEQQQQQEEEEKCDFFSGDWVPNPSGPLYTSDSCPFIESPQNCQRNGRPDSAYLFWKWRPRCPRNLPHFDPPKFLDSMRNKSWALIGDSISRNHVQSLLCILSTAEQAVEVYHDEDYKSRRWHFPSHNFTISVIWSPFLVEANIFEDNNGVSTHEVELHLDKIDEKWKELYQEFNYIIFSTGKWFLKGAIYHENNAVIGCHYCPARNLTELGFDFGYRRALEIVMNFIASSSHKGLVFFRMSTPDHFENGEWHNGGTCLQTTPVKEDMVQLKDVHKILHDIELDEFKKAATKAADNEVNFKLLDFTNMSLTRPDGHPGPYRQFQPFAKDKNAKVQNDCLHWCLPGPIDSWNDVIMEMVLNS